MNNPGPNPPSDELNAYLDGLLSRAEREAFARRLTSDARLRDEVTLHERIGRQLQARFQPPAAPPLDLPTPAGSDPAPAARNGHARPLKPSASPRGPHAAQRLAAWVDRLPFRWLLVTLTVVTAGVLIGMVWNRLAGWSGRDIATERPLTEVWAKAVDLGFNPQLAYQGQEQLQRTFFQRHGQAIRLEDLPGDRQVLGLSYLPSLSVHTTAILAQSEGQPVIVFADKLARDRSVKSPPAGSKLRIHRRQLGTLVLYELSPFDEAQIVSLLQLADPPPDDCLVD
jgi:hypothetical protein